MNDKVLLIFMLPNGKVVQRMMVSRQVPQTLTVGTRLVISDNNKIEDIYIGYEVISTVYEGYSNGVATVITCTVRETGHRYENIDQFPVIR